MATTKSAKIWAEMEKVKAKISDQQARLKELEQNHKEAENEEIIDIVRGMSIPWTSCPSCSRSSVALLVRLARSPLWRKRGWRNEKAPFAGVPAVRRPDGGGTHCPRLCRGR